MANDDEGTTARVGPVDGREVTLVGNVVDCHSGEHRRTACSLLLRRRQAGDWEIRVWRGAVTGFESFLIDGPGAWRRLRDGGWCACAGRRGEYNTLTFDAAELRRALAELGFEGD